MKCTKVLIALYIITLISGCKTTYLPAKLSTRDTTYIYNSKIDSVIIKDSVIMQVRGDTMFVERIKKERVTKERIDTIYKHIKDSIPYIVVKEVPQKFLHKTSILPILAVALIVLFFFVKAKKRL